MSENKTMPAFPNIIQYAKDTPYGPALNPAASADYAYDLAAAWEARARLALKALRIAMRDTPRGTCDCDVCKAREFVREAIAIIGELPEAGK